MELVSAFGYNSATNRLVTTSYETDGSVWTYGLDGEITLNSAAGGGVVPPSNVQGITFHDGDMYLGAMAQSYTQEAIYRYSNDGSVLKGVKMVFLDSTKTQGMTAHQGYLITLQNLTAAQTAVFLTK